MPRFVRRLWPFFLWLSAFYSVWLVIVIAGNHWQTVRDHWPISVAMAFGSYVAGSTPMGGGTIGFPVLALLLDQPAALGRNFALAIQSIGMVSASVFILSARQSLEWRLLRPGMVGSLIATPLGAAFVAPMVPDLTVKLLFAVIWASFGVMHLLRMREIVWVHRDRLPPRRMDAPVGLSIGLIGGIVASVTGVGIDMILYAVLVLLYRGDLKVAIRTSVLLMAFNSLVGIGSNALLASAFPADYRIDPEVFANWLAAAPVVAVGAPLGAWIVQKISRTPTLVFVSILCLVQFVWTLVDQRVTGLPLAGALLGVLLVNLGFHAMYRWGEANDPSVRVTATPLSRTEDARTL